ncbi:MAG: DUF2127 domain-containing protein [Hyalangium sp.]|uniref:DUF2127 domain-containing protein n=1 Tax=Hyalangium sp. TaxID=2028555 RepID=UPI00389B237F
MATQPEGHSESSGAALVAIGVFKLVKVALLVALGVMAFKSQKEDIPALVMHWGSAYTGPAVQRLVALFAGKVAETDPRKMQELGIAAFAYAAVFTVEGVGLLMRRRWAEYLTIGVTASLLPFEIYECIHHFTATKVATLVVNVAVLVYLFWRVRHHESRKPSRRPHHRPAHA